MSMLAGLFDDLCTLVDELRETISLEHACLPDCQFCLKVVNLRVDVCNIDEMSDDFHFQPQRDILKQLNLKKKNRTRFVQSNKVKYECNKALIRRK